jgi:PTH1 family peptidyl-tRNA hydrolase
MKIIIGLGNIGQEYNNTRHNIGFIVLDSWLKKINQLFHTDHAFRENKKLDALIVKLTVDGNELVLVKPTTFMNLSGICVTKIFNYYRAKIEDLIIIQDELDLEFGRLNIKLGGGDGGHHGVESIINNLPSSEFVRLRIGIGRNGAGSLMNKIDGAKYVLSKFPKADEEKLESIIDHSGQALDCMIKNKIEQCMNQYNKKIPNKLPLE